MDCIYTDNIIDMVEGTTRYVNITMVDKEGKPSHSDENVTSTCSIKLGKDITILETTQEENVISFVIPPELTIGKSSGKFEVRVFEDAAVVSIIIGKLNIKRSPNPILSKP